MKNWLPPSVPPLRSASVHAIMTATEEISTTSRESMDLVEEIRKVHAPRSYEIDCDDY